MTAKFAAVRYGLGAMPKKKKKHKTSLSAVTRNTGHVNVVVVCVGGRGRGGKMRKKVENIGQCPLIG